MKRIVAVVAVILMIINMAACSSSTDAAGKAGGTTGGTTSGSALKSTLSVYYMLNTNYVYNAICEFKGLYGNVNIEPKLFTTQSIDEFNRSMSTEILSGGGPDIFICKPLRDVDSISRIFSNGVFVDLNDFISKDDDFKLDNFDKSVFDAGVINGRREFVPLYYSTPLFYTTETVLRENGINIDEDCTIKELGNAVDSFIKNKTRKSKYLFDSLFNFFYLLNFYGESFIDYKNKKCDFGTEEFKDLLRLYKRMQTVIAPEDEFQNKYSYSELSLMKNDRIAIMTDTLGTVWDFFCDNSYADYYYNEELKIISFSGSTKTGKIRPIITDVAAINNNCKNKKLAYYFIKVLLSDQIQKMMYTEYISNSHYNPVNNTTYSKALSQYSKPVEDMKLGSLYYKESENNYKEVKLITMSETFMNRLKGLKGDIAEPLFLDKAVKTIIDDAVKEYLSGKYNEDATAKLINDKIQLFLNE